MPAPGLQELMSMLGGGAGGMGLTMPPGAGGPPGVGMMPPGPPGPPGSSMPEIPAGGSQEMIQQVQSIGTQLSSIGARLMSMGSNDAAIACAKAVKELEKVPELVSQSQPPGGPPNMGGPGMGAGGGPSLGMPPGPPPMPGMSQ